MLKFYWRFSSASIYSFSFKDKNESCNFADFAPSFVRAAFFKIQETAPWEQIGSKYFEKQNWNLLTVLMRPNGMDIIVLSPAISLKFANNKKVLKFVRLLSISHKFSLILKYFCKSFYVGQALQLVKTYNFVSFLMKQLKQWSKMRIDEVYLDTRKSRGDERLI